MKIKGIAMTSSSNRTSKDKHGDLFSFFLARLKISVDSRNYNLILECPACQRIWHAGHARIFGIPGMPEIFAGYELLINRA